MRIRRAEIPEPIANSYLFLSDVPRYARTFVSNSLSGIHAERTVVATYGDEIIGFVRYSVAAKQSTITACGTWVRAKFRRLGVGKLMWKYIIRSEKPAMIRASVVSKEGRRLFERLEKTYKRVLIDVVYL